MPGSVRPAARIAGERHRAGRAAVIRAISREDLVPPGERARDLDRVLVRVGAAVGEEEHVDVARREARQLRAQLCARLGRHERARVRQHRRLLGDRARHALVAVADVHAHQLAVEVDVALAFRRPEVDAFRARHRDRIDGSPAATIRRSCACGRDRRSPRLSSCPGWSSWSLHLPPTTEGAILIAHRLVSVRLWFFDLQLARETASPPAGHA